VGLTDRFQVLHDQLTEAAARGSRRRRARPLLLLAAALVVGGSATAAVVSQTSEPSAPLTGTVPRAKPSAPLRTYSFAIFPRLSAGNPSWCTRVRVMRAGRAVFAGSGCGPAPVDGSFLLGGGVEGAGTGVAAFVVGPDVATVRLGKDRKIVPGEDARVPQPWRVVVAFTPPRKLTAPPPPGTTGPAPSVPDAFPLPLDANDHPLPQPSEKLASALRTHSRRLHSIPAHGCALLGGPRPRFADVAPARSAQPVATVGPAFRACFVATYGIGRRYLQAALIVDATDPDRPAPAFPNAIAAGAGTVHAPGAMLARCAGNAWIVVRAGPPAVRRRLLNQLRARLR
jgi:hypothetical protein